MLDQDSTGTTTVPHSSSSIMGTTWRGSGPRGLRDKESRYGATAMDAASTDTFQLRNAARDQVHCLPHELVSEAFRSLDLWDCVAVSHVSRDWRAVALNDPLLWNDANLSPLAARPPPTVPPRDARYRVVPAKPLRPELTQHRADMFLELLRRSFPLPFRLTWFGSRIPPVPQHMVTVIAQHMERMQTLALRVDGPDFQRLLEVSAPLLTSFRASISGSVYELPTVWDAPVLETLDLCPIRIPAGMQPMPSVVLFSCSASDDLGGPETQLFQIFPSLRSLKIEMHMAETLPGMSNPPMSLTHVHLRTYRGPTEVYYAPFMRACAGKNVRTLYLETASSCADVLELFTSTIAGTWSMNAEWRRVVHLTAPDEGAAYEIVCVRPLSLRRDPNVATHFSRLASLTAHARLLVDLDALGNWSRTLPELRDLTLQLPSPGLAETLPPPVQLTQILAPSLETVALQVNHSVADESERWARDVFPDFLRSRFILGRARLATITLDTWLERGPDGSGLDALSALADCMRVNVLGRNGETLEYGDDGERA